MEHMNQLSDPTILQKSLQAVIHLAEQYKKEKGRIPVFMEVCGSHTMSFAKSGIKSMLRDYVRLIAGPGCPVCVTEQKSIDAMIELSKEPNRILCTFGDMIRVPGSRFSLMDAKTAGKDIRVMYSPLDSIKIAEENPDKEVIFLGIGFETTIPILAVTIQEAEKKALGNYSIWMATKLVEPVLRTLLQSKEINLDGFILPGHVSVVTGKNSFDFLVENFQISGVITGFEPVELLRGIYKLLQQLINEEYEIINDYTYMVKNKGNTVALNMMEKYFDYHDEAWRGMSVIQNSGLVLKNKYAMFDAKKKFHVSVKEPKKTKCRCGEIIRGVTTPEECVLFNKGCTPLHPIGPCMVSTEGTCAAHYQYMREG